MSDADLDQLDKLTAEATSEPWEPNPLGSGVFTPRGMFPGVRYADAAFIAAARHAVPALVRELRRLRESLARIRDYPHLAVSEAQAALRS